MASFLLRSLRGSAVRRAVSAAAAAAPSGAEGLAVRSTVPLPPNPLRRMFCVVTDHQTPKVDPKYVEEKANLLHQSLKEMNVNLDKKFTIYALLQLLNEERKPHNPFYVWSMQVAAVFLVTYISNTALIARQRREGKLLGADHSTPQGWTHVEEDADKGSMSMR